MGIKPTPMSMIETTSLYSINARSLNATTVNQLMNTISHHQDTTKQQQNYPTNTIVTVQETWWKAGTKSAHPSLAPMKVVYNNRPNGRGGGMAIILSPDIVHTIRGDLSTNNFIQATAVEIPARTTILATIYASDHHNLVPPFIIMLTRVAKSEGKQLLITGDFSAHHDM